MSEMLTGYSKISIGACRADHKPLVGAMPADKTRRDAVRSASC